MHLACFRFWHVKSVERGGDGRRGGGTDGRREGEGWTEGGREMKTGREGD